MMFNKIATSLFGLLFLTLLLCRENVEAQFNDCGDEYFTSNVTSGSFLGLVEDTSRQVEQRWIAACREAKANPAFAYHADKCFSSAGTTRALLTFVKDNLVLINSHLSSIRVSSVEVVNQAEKLGLGQFGRKVPGRFVVHAAGVLSLIIEHFNAIFVELGDINFFIKLSLRNVDQDPILNGSVVLPITGRLEARRSIVVLGYAREAFSKEVRSYESCTVSEVEGIVAIAAAGQIVRVQKRNGNNGGAAAGGNGNLVMLPGGSDGMSAADSGGDAGGSSESGIFVAMNEWSNPVLSGLIVPLDFTSALLSGEEFREIDRSNSRYSVVRTVELAYEVPEDAVFTESVLSPIDGHTLIPQGAEICLVPGFRTDAVVRPYDAASGCLPVDYGIDLHYKKSDEELPAVCSMVGHNMLRPGQSISCPLQVDSTGSPQELANGAVRGLSIETYSTGFKGRHITTLLDITLALEGPNSSCYSWNGDVWVSTGGGPECFV